MDNFDLRKYLAEGKLYKENVNEDTVLEGFLDKVAKVIQGKSDQGAALEKALQQLMPGFKNGEFVYTTSFISIASLQDKYNLVEYISSGGDLNAKFPFPTNGFSSGDDSPAQSWRRNKVTFNFNAEVPTVQFDNYERFDIKQQKFVPDDTGYHDIPKEPTEITPKDMSSIKENEGVYTQVKMVPIADAVKNWPGRTGDALRKSLAKRQEK